MTVRALGLMAIATALFAPIYGAQPNTEGSTPGKCLDVTHKDDVTHKVKVPGVEPKVLLNEQPIPTVPDKCIRVTQLVIDPGADVRCHTHPGDEFGIVLGGNLMLQRDGGEYEPAPKQFLVPRDQQMNVKNSPDSDAKGVLLSILIIDPNAPPLTYCDGEEGHH